MKKLLTFRLTLASSLLLGLTALGMAQTLGPLRAEAWIGRPLEVSLPANLAAGEARDGCVHADVFYGDQRLGAHQVRTSVVGSPQQQRVKVEADRIVDEPVVTVAVRAGCANTVSRSYTLLPEFPSEAMLAAAAAPRGAQPGGVPTSATAAPRAVLHTQAAGAPPARPPALRPAVLRTQAALRPPRGRDPNLIRVNTDGASRLQVQNWEPDAQTMLRVSAHLTEPTQDAARRATAALLWQALNADPSELMRANAAMQKLEGELAQLRQAAGQTRSEMLALRQRLDGPQPGLFPARIAELLALLLLLTAGTAAFLWYRGQRAGRAAREWSGAPLDSLPADLSPAQAPLEPRPAAQPQSFAPVAKPASVKPAGLADAAAAPQRREPSLVVPAVASLPPPARRPPASAALRIETLAATFEEAEFLSSLGLWNDAMDVLKTYIEDSEGPAPLAFFELMRLCVNTDDAATLVAVRKRYAKVYRKEAPKFDLINAAPGLDGYPDLASHITRAWGTPAALDLIEQSLFMVPVPTQAFSLNAGRDLLVLHDLATALVRDGAQGAGAGADDEQALAPWASAESPDHARAITHGIEAMGGHRFALDLDLGAVAVDLGDNSRHEADLAQQALLAQFEAARGAPQPQSAQEIEDAFSAAVANEKIRSVSRF